MNHGGDLLSYKHYYEGELTDYSSNINPLGFPKGLTQIMVDSFKELEAYPDIKYRKLKESVAAYLNCDEENTVLGNGAVEVIDNFTFLADRVLICVPSFSEYEERAIVHGKQVVRVSYNEDFTLDTKSLEDIMRDGDMLILGNPNNPTGLRIDKSQLIDIYNIVKEKRAFLLLDEAFFEFCPKDYDSIEIFKDYDFKYVGIIRAATKFFALPGIRLGYGCTSVDMVKKIQGIQLPWSINSVAEAAGRYIFSDEEYIKESKIYIDEERRHLFEKLSDIRGIKAYPTQTNYMLIKLLNHEEQYVFEYFLNRGIIIRKCTSFKVLGKDHIRVAIKDRANNQRLIEIFKELGESK